MNSYLWSDLAVGLSASFDAQVTEKDLERFREISGDENPLHADDDYAKSQNFKGRVVHGLLVASYYSRLVGMYLPGRSCLLHGIDVDCVNVVYPGDRLNISGSITHLNQAYHQATLSATITNEQGVKVSRAKIRVGLHGT